MALSISNWVSTQVMRVMLGAFQRELEAMMRPALSDGIGGTVMDIVGDDDDDDNDADADGNGNE